MTHSDIVRKLIGKINPIGETETDNQRFKNLEQLCNLVENLLMDIDDVAFKNKDSHEYSVKRAADFAKKFLEVTISHFQTPNQ